MASISGSDGFVGVATQSALGDNPAEGTYTYFEATAAPMQPQDIARSRRPTIGEKPHPRDAYKVGTSVAGAIGLEATPDAAGKLLFLMLGKANTPIFTGTNVRSHVLRYDPADQYAVPYFKARRGIAEAILETAADCKIERGVITMAPGDAVQMAFNYRGRIPDQSLTQPVGVQEVQRITFGAGCTTGAFTLVTDTGETGSITFSAVTATMAGNIETALNAIYGASAVDVAYVSGLIYAITWAETDDRALMTLGANTLNGATTLVTLSTAGSAGIVYDSTPILVTGVADSNLEVGAYTTSSGAIIGMGAQIAFTNMLTPPSRLKIGSPYPIDFTNLDRDLTIQLSLEIADNALYRKVFNNGGSAWDPTPWIGAFKIKAASSTKTLDGAGTNDTPHSMEMLCNQMHFSAMLIANEPRRVVEATLTASLLKAVGANEPVQFTVVTERVAAFS